MTMRTILRTLATASLLALLAVPAFAAVTITIINLDGPGEGFNDATPAAPVGGNPGTTVGQQRLLCFQQAAGIWGATLTSSVPIQIQAAFNPLACTATSAVLGSAGPRFVELNDPLFEFQNYWYHEALANKEAGVDHGFRLVLRLRPQRGRADRSAGRVAARVRPRSGFQHRHQWFDR